LIDATAVGWLQVEATTKCNAWCPGCGRNKGGFELADGLVIEDLDVDRYKEILNQFPNLKTVDFCGTYGDAIAAANIVELVNVTKQHVDKIIVRTNGSLRTVAWWNEYAELLKDIDHEVWFCLDGLEDTHSVYRQGTDYNKIIANAQEFIGAGGTAVWQFIPWAHNEHQIKDCIKLSQLLGFKRFELKRRVRDNFEARHYQTGAPIEIRNWSQNTKYNVLKLEKNVVHKENCMHLTLPSMYLHSNGQLNVCCFFNRHGAKDSVSELPDIQNHIDNPAQLLDVCRNSCSRDQ
jgi:MoaA/NifB/PqqE/SkfB family radical SAM enzyme